MDYKINNKDEFISLVKTDVLTSSEALELLEVSRQSLNSLVKRGKIVPIKELSREKLYLREDILSRKKEQDELRKKYRPYDEEGN